MPRRVLLDVRALQNAYLLNKIGGEVGEIIQANDSGKRMRSKERIVKFRH